MKFASSLLVLLTFLSNASFAVEDTSHADLFEKDRFPSATACGECHPKHYKEWSVSQHAYAQMSPVFNAFHGTILKFSRSTNGDFCIRCHTPVGMNLEEDIFMSNIDRHPTSREGVTCIACHRLSQPYGKLSGRLAIAEGPVTEPIFGPSGEPAELERAISKAGLVVDNEKTGRKIHGEVARSDQMSTSGFCGTCHDVNLVNGFRLEEAFSEFKNSPANAEGITCQDCHNYSVLPPSLFPLDLRAIKEEKDKDDVRARGMATIREWLQFDWKAGWGTDEFEDEVDYDFEFPERWESVDDRYDAREIIQDNLVLLKQIEQERLKLLRNGYLLGDISVDKVSRKGIEFVVAVKNGTNGHNVPTGFDAERLVWLYVKVVDADGKVLKESGDLDPNGDVRDLHSAYVHNRELPLDKELFSLQSKFLVRNIVGGEREQVLAINYSVLPPSLFPLDLRAIKEEKDNTESHHFAGET